MIQGGRFLLLPTLTWLKLYSHLSVNFEAAASSIPHSAGGPGELGPRLTLLRPWSSRLAQSLGPVQLEMHEARSFVI